MAETKTSTYILTLVNSTIDLPTMPEVLVKLNEVMADPDITADDVAKVAVKAATDRKLRGRYYAPLGAHLQSRLLPLLPTSLLERILLRLYKVPPPSK